MSAPAGLRGRRSRPCWRAPRPVRRAVGRSRRGHRARPTRELGQAAHEFAAALVVSGVTPGDRVAIWAFNSAEWVVAVLGIFAAGGVLVPVNTRFKGPEAADMLSPEPGLGRSSPSPTSSATTTWPCWRTPGSRSRPSRPSSSPGGRGRAGARRWSDFLDRATPESRGRGGASERRARTRRSLGHPLHLGDDGSPQGRRDDALPDADRRHRLGRHDGTRRRRLYLMVNPYFHMFGLKSGILSSVASGATMLPEPVFDVDRVCRGWRRSTSRCCPGPPTLYQAILDHPDRHRHDLSSLRVAVTGAADIPVELIRRIHDELPFSQDRHRLRAHRGRHGLLDDGRGRRRGDRHHRRPAPTRVRDAHRRRGRP